MAKNKELQTIYQKIVVGFIFITIILILAILYFSFNKATITVIPKKEMAETDFVATVEASKTDKAIDTIQGEIWETTVEAKKQFNSSGVKVLSTNVTGQVTIINESVKSQDLIAKTRLLTTDNILFRTKKIVSVPAGGKVDVDVYADDSNLAMDVLPTKFTIPGLWSELQKKIYGVSYEKFSGVKKETKVISDQDINNARNSLAEELVGGAVDDFKNKLGEKSDSLTFAKIVQNLNYSVDAKPDDSKDNFNINLKLKVGLAVFNQDELLALASEKLKYSLPDDRELADITMNQFKYSIKSYDIATMRAAIDVHLEGTAVVKEDNSIFDKNKLVGLTKDQIVAYFRNFDIIESVETSFSPFWVYKVPNLKDHIILRIKK
jgi:hypothetical protein